MKLVLYGDELLNRIADILGIPQSARDWSLHAPMEGPAYVEMEVLLDWRDAVGSRKELTKVSERYMLRKREDDARCENCARSVLATVQKEVKEQRGDGWISVRIKESEEALLCDLRGGIDVAPEMCCPRWERRKEDHK